MFKTLTAVAFMAVWGWTLPAQSLTGVATYKTATAVKFEMKSSQFSPEQQKRFQERMAAAGRKEFKLHFNSKESLYQEVEALQKEGARGGFFMMMGSGGGATIYKNLPEGRFTKQTEFFGKAFLIKDSLPQNKWQLSNETKSIGKYPCYKATYQDIKKSLRIERENGERKDTVIIDTIQVVAWYTPQVPVSNGPEEYGGLPGLILELNNGTTTYVCSQIVLNPEEKVSIKEPNQGKEVSDEEYRAITKAKIEEMREMNRNNGRRRSGSSSFEISID